MSLGVLFWILMGVIAVSEELRWQILRRTSDDRLAINAILCSKLLKHAFLLVINLKIVMIYLSGSVDRSCGLDCSRWIAELAL